MSTRARRSVGVGRHFPVGQRRHVPVVDTGCGCRPRRPRLLSLPSFLKPSLSKPVPARSASRSSSSFFPSSSSTASFSSSSAATYTTNYSSSYSSNYSNYYYSHGYGATKGQVHDPPTKVPPASSPVQASAPVAKRQLSTKKKRYVEKAEAAAEEDVGVAVEKESSDPRADFRESMVQMVAEMGLCDWDDLRCMLRRLLALNAPRHHAAILTAFAEVCAQLTAPPAPPPAYHQYRL